MDDGIRERHGVMTEHVFNTAPITIYEENDAVFLVRPAGDRKLSPAEARYLARKLTRLAERIEARGATK